MLFVDTDVVSAPMVIAFKLASTAAAPGGSSKDRNRMVGVAFADTNSRQLGVSSFIENDAFSNTEVTFVYETIHASLTCVSIDACHSTRYQRSSGRNGYIFRQD